jgi:acyl-CoA synthetase (AMP-forming)/AMP-acid ligase II
VIRLALANEHRGPQRHADVATLLERGRQRFGGYRGRSVALLADDPLTPLEALLAAAEVGFALTILADAAATSPAGIRLEERDGELVERPAPADDEGPPEAGLVILTSGSTGTPKRTLHTFESLDTFASVDPRAERWLVSYRPGTYAWAQAVVLALSVPGHELVFPASLAPGDILDALLEHGVTAASGTPTFWRYLLTAVPVNELRSASLRQITLGGERVDQPILDALRHAFPEARLTHIYATAETGPALRASDGWAGYPAESLDRPVLGGHVHVRIQDGTLHVRSPWAADRNAAWVDTGDVAEVSGGRIHIVGRRDRDVINVGGTKVRPDTLEDFVRELEGIRWARATGIPSRIAGELVGLEVVVDSRRWADLAAAERFIVQSCSERLPEHYLPRVVRFLDAVPLGPSMKTDA